MRRVAREVGHGGAGFDGGKLGTEVQSSAGKLGTEVQGRLWEVGQEGARYAGAGSRAQVRMMGAESTV